MFLVGVKKAERGEIVTMSIINTIPVRIALSFLAGISEHTEKYLRELGLKAERPTQNMVAIAVRFSYKC
ncbi:MAG: hypothetical protein QNJ34_11890 [Xenococcaceae cyanobacterium MO_188.B29]|nr:hypothetical protein [Xenococcaceae cyanobacterium MO_188.B29]